MKASMGLFAIVLLTACHTSPRSSSNSDIPPASAESKIIESSILWRAEIDPVTWEPIALRKMVSDRQRFRPFGNFYEARENIEAFGNRVKYIGLIGIEYVSGPNVTIDAPPAQVARYISDKYDLPLSRQADEYHTEIGKDLVLVVAPHPTQEGVSMVIGAYLGP